MIVVDTNVVAYLFLPGPFEFAARSLRQRDPNWIVPVIWRSEFRNVLAGHMRCKGLTFAEAITTQCSAEELFDGAEFMVDSVVVLELIHSSKCSAYDCEFVGLARSKGIQLVTADKLLLRSFPQIAMSMGDFA